MAVALCNDPAVLLADEPTGELDTLSETVVLELIAAAAARGTAVVVASHSPEVASAADRVIRLAYGAVVS
jgi:putative ABC transport system ATP-binding protein